MALKELPDLLALEPVEVEGRETIDRLVVLLLDEPLRVTLEPILLEGLEVLTLELLLVEGLEALTLELLLLVEGLEELTLELMLVEGLEVLTLELEDLEELEGRELLTLELEDLEEVEALEGAELLETDRLLPLDLLDFFAVTGPASNIKAKVTVSKISQTFLDFFKVYMAFLLTSLAYFYPIHVRTKSTFIRLLHYKTQKFVKKRFFRSFIM